MGRAAKIVRAGRSRCAAPAAPGFTLLEVIVTMAILVLAVAVVTPAIGRGTEGLRARAEVASFAATLRHAREQAITTQRPYRVAVDTEANRVSVTTLPGPGSLPNGFATLSSADPTNTTPGGATSQASASTFGSSTGTSTTSRSTTTSRFAPASRAVPGRSTATDTNTNADAEINRTRTLSSRFVIETAQPSEVIFDTRGGASGGDFKLTSGGVTYRVTVDRLSGRVRSVRE